MRYPQAGDDWHGPNRRRMVCKSCHMVMEDGEPMAAHGEFFHKTKHKDGSTSKCKNAGKTFYEGDREVEEFVRKRIRRASKRAAR